MSDETTQTSETQDAEVSDAPAVDEQLGDAGKRALVALRDEVKSLKSQLKAYASDAGQRDAASAEDESSEDARSNDVDGERVATTAEDVKPAPLKFQGTADGGAMRGTAPERQLTRDDLKRMNPRKVDEARRKGLLRDLLSGH